VSVRLGARPLALRLDRHQMKPMDLALLRPNVGIVLFAPSGLVWLGRRANTPPPQNWQFPQGGIDAGEGDLDAAIRELREEAAIELDDPLALLRRLDGVVVIVEPALRETGRALLEARDVLLREGWFALAPCLMQSPCPALASPRDWCTAEVRWTPPPYFRQLADATGLRADEMLSFAPLILSRAPPAPRPDTWRVVGVAPPEKGKKRVWLCGAEERVPLVRLDRDRREANERFDGLRRGDLVRLRGADRRGDGLRLGPQSSLTDG